MVDLENVIWFVGNLVVCGYERIYTAERSRFKPVYNQIIGTASLGNTSPKHSEEQLHDR